MRILITGGTGFIGSALAPALIAAGHRVTVLTRQRRDNAAYSDPSLRFVRELADAGADVDAVINLAGASLADRRWTPRYKRELRDSRIALTERLGDWLASLGNPPSVLLSASAIGFYGARGDEQLTEDSDRGAGFAADLCVDWEAAATRAAPPGCRLCVMRIGVVFDRDGGAYPRMAMPFRFGLGNWIGSGRQWLSWIHRRDLVAAMMRLLDDAQAQGVFNLTAPAPVTSRGLSEAMRQLRPQLLALPVPAGLLRLGLGEVADELLINGQRVLPQRLTELGFTFQYPDLASALPVLEGRDPG